jgi:hypothetical protein
MSVCKWCRKPRATEADHGDDDTDPKNHLCWREWNDYSECHEIERRLREIAPLMRDALFAEEEWRDEVNAAHRDTLRAKAADLRGQVMTAIKSIQ